MNSFFRELKQRKVYRVALGYAVVAWLVIQISATVMPAYHAPDWFLPIFITVIALGFPVALVLAWAFELKGGAIEKAPEPTGHLSAANKRRVWLLAAAGLIISGLAVGGYWMIWHSSCNTSAAKSIAVLPFENLSEEKANAYFAEGIQDEILTRLATVRDLKVISRTSTAKYQSKPDNLKTVAQELGVTTVLEGAVQKAGDKVRVNVKLIDARADTHLWAKSYDRDFKDVLGVESEVSQEIAGALQAKLTGREGQALAVKPTNNPQAYDAYLRGLAYTLKIGFTPANSLGAQKYLKEAVRLDPKFALSWAVVGGCQRLPHTNSSTNGRPA
jgi:TolB-like protein